MNTANMNYCETSKNVNLSKRITILEFICLISYLYIYYIIYKKTNAYFNKKIEEKVVEEEKDVNTWYTIEDGKARYKGEWNNGVPHGKGTKEKFEGLYKDVDGKPCDSNGKPCCWSMIECNFVNGVAEGYGKQIYKQEDEETQPYYEGEFHNCKHHGQGAYYYGTGDYYKGNFKESKFHGVGYHYYVKKDITWVGEFDNDKKIKGVRVDGELDEYEYKKKAVKVEEVKVEEVKVEEIKVEEVKVEEVKEKVEEVKVKLEAVESSSKAEEKDVNTWYTIEDEKARYKGEWKNGLPNGKGIKYFYKTDSYIEGNFVDSFAHGYGKQTFEKTQTWEKTVPYYEGEFNRNNYDGKGEYHFGDGDYYKGMWKNNKYHGQGAAYSKLLDKTWVGEYENDVKGEGNWVKGEI